MPRKTTISLIKCDVGSLASRHRMDEFEPARLRLEEMEYTTLEQILEKLKDHFKPT